MDGRVQNILLASSKINDTLIGPGEEFSFNEKVGARTEDSGFKNAPTLFMGEIFPGIGGGTCQVSSTLYATMILTGIEASERRPHSRPSNYISPGFDATVSYPAECLEKSDPTICYDLRFWNPYEFPLHIKTEIGPEMSEKEKQELFDPKRSLKISIFGMGETPKVTTKWASWKTSPFKKRYRRVHYWRDGRMRLKQAGVLGNEGALHVKLTYADGYTVDRKIHSRYQPVSEVWEVGMAWENPEVTVIE
jgi:hypothetical protein